MVQLRQYRQVCPQTQEQVVMKILKLYSIPQIPQILRYQPII